MKLDELNRNMKSQVEAREKLAVGIIKKELGAFFRSLTTQDDFDKFFAFVKEHPVLLLNNKFLFPYGKKYTEQKYLTLLIAAVYYANYETDPMRKQLYASFAKRCVADTDLVQKINFTSMLFDQNTPLHRVAGTFIQQIWLEENKTLVPVMVNALIEIYKIKNALTTQKFYPLSYCLSYASADNNNYYYLASRLIDEMGISLLSNESPDQFVGLIKLAAASGDSKLVLSLLNIILKKDANFISRIKAELGNELINTEILSKLEKSSPTEYWTLVARLTDQKVLAMQMITPGFDELDPAPGDPQYQSTESTLHTIQGYSEFSKRIFIDPESPYYGVTHLALWGAGADKNREKGYINSAVLDSTQISYNKQLQRVARNEAYNTSGLINDALFLEGVPTRQNETTPNPYILSAKDIVSISQFTIERCKVTHVGGYPRGTERIKNLNPDMAYAVDLIGLQFQQPYNTGRLVLIAPPGSPLPQGKFDNELFEKIVSEPKASYAQAEADNTGRYRKICAFGADHYLDTDAYAQFVKQHFISVALALHQRAVEDGTSGISFKFTRYGAGYFSKGIGLDTDEAESVKTQLEKEMEAEKPGLTARLRKKALEDKEIAAISDSMQKEMAINNKIQVLRTKELDSRVALVREGITEECILKGIILALEKLAQENKATAISKIKRIELPYYAGATRSKDEIKKIEERCLALGIEFVCKKEDILKKTSKNTSAFTLATDSNAAARNEGSCGSLGAYGYESITGRGYHSNVHINQKMLERTATNRLYSSLTPQEQQAVCLERAKDAVQRYLREVEGLNSSSWGKHGEKGKDKARQVIGCKNVQELIKVLKEINAEAKEKSILAKAGVTEHSLSSYLVKSLSGIVGMDMANELLTSTRNKVMLDRIVPELEKIVLPLFAGETAGLTRAM